MRLFFQGLAFGNGVAFDLVQVQTRPQGQTWQSMMTARLQQGGQRLYERPQWQPMAPMIQKDLNAMDVDQNMVRRPSIECFKCGELGHIARNCRSGLDIHAMRYEDIEKYVKERLTKQGFLEDTAQWLPVRMSRTVINILCCL